MLVKTLLERAGRHSVQTINTHDPVKVAIQIFSGARFRSLPVVDGDALAGIVTTRDLLHFLVKRGGAGMEVPISEAMTKSPSTVSPDDPVEKAQVLLSGRFNHLPVVENNKLVGLLTNADLLGVRLADVRAFAGDLERYITGH